MTSSSSSLDHLATLADSTRSRLLLVLERHEVTVGELCAILQLPQSTVSRHLKVLGDDGWVSSRADGTSRYYRIDASPDQWADRIWSVVRDDVSASSAARRDATRERSVLAARRSRAREFFSTAAAGWDAMRAELFGSRPDLHIAFALLDPKLTVGDLGCGTGHLSALLAPHVARVVAVDGSSDMLAAARESLRDWTNVDVQQGDLEQLPLPDGTLDAAILSLVLPYVSEPARAIAEACRVLRPGGQLVVIDMTPHNLDDMQLRMGHIWRGFSEEQVRGWFIEAGFGQLSYQALPPDTQAKGPLLFLANGKRS